jgi:hypothetical protein
MVTVTKIIARPDEHLLRRSVRDAPCSS